jgi:hypothetical protein
MGIVPQIVTSERIIVVGPHGSVCDRLPIDGNGAVQLTMFPGADDDLEFLMLV